MMHYQVVMNKIAMKALHKSFVVAALQTYTVIYPCIVYHAINPSKLLYDLLNGFFTFLRNGKFGSDFVRHSSFLYDSVYSIQVIFFTATDNNRNGSFFRQCLYNAFTNAFGTPGYYNDLIF